jgi:ParB family chromosome partitioning protein
MAKKRLGIDALFQTAVPSAVPAASGDAREMDVAALTPGRSQPRSTFDEAGLADLADSIRAHGVIQPLIVRRGADGTYEIVAGERRWRAAKTLGLARVPVRVLDLDDADALAVAMIENLQREDLNPLEEAEGYLELLRERLAGETAFQPLVVVDDPRAGILRLLRALNNRNAGNTAAQAKDNVVLSLEPAVVEVFKRVGRLTWPSFVAHRLPLLGLQDDLRAAIRSGGLEYTKARLIGRVTAERTGGDEGRARKLRRDLIEQSATEGLSVRALQHEVARILDEASPRTAPAARRGAKRATSAADLSLRIAALRDTLASIDVAKCDDARREIIASRVAALLRELVDD